jgi:hypothetical protein
MVGWRRAPLVLDGFNHLGLSYDVNKDDGIDIENLDL